MRENPHSQSAKVGRIVKFSNSPLPEVFERGSSRRADKIALKIYPFGIDYPIVLKELKLTHSLYVIPAKAGIQ